MSLDACYLLTLRSNSNWTSGTRYSTDPWFISWSRWANSVVVLNSRIDIEMFLSPGSAGTEVRLTLVTLRPVYAIHHGKSNNSSYCHPPPPEPFMGWGSLTSSLLSTPKENFSVLDEITYFFNSPPHHHNYWYRKLELCSFLQVVV